MMALRCAPAFSREEQNRPSLSPGTCAASPDFRASGWNTRSDNKLKISAKQKGRHPGALFVYRWK
jgi:hypothetical protein